MNHVAGVAAPEPAVHAGGGAHRRIADIELLRGVAVVMVLIEHLPINLVGWHSPALDALGRYWRGWPGVDLFFVISGFVIGRSLLPMTNGEVAGMRFLSETLVFWTRRAWRLLPSAWLWLLIPFLASIAFNRSGLFSTPLVNYRSMIAGLLDVANFHLADGYGRLPYGTTFPYWSLSLEEQFYLALPLLIFVLRRRLPWLLGLVVLAQFQAPHLPLTMVTRSGALALGVLLAFWSDTPAWRLCEPLALRRLPARIVMLLLPILLLGALGTEQVVGPSLEVGLVALLGGVLVWVASYDRDYLAAGLLPRRLMLWLGSRSYGIYLIHIPAFAASREIWFRLSPPGTVFDGSFWRCFGATALVLVLSLSELNHRLVEQPLRRHGAAIAGRMMRRRLVS